MFMCSWTCHRMWQRTVVREGEVGCLLDEIQNLVGPTERRTMDGPAGPQRGRMPVRRGRARAPDSPVPGAEVLRSTQAASADVRPGSIVLVDYLDISNLCRQSPNGPAR
jgi:hypothetical protein